MAHLTLVSLGVFITGAVAATILFDTNDSLGLKGKILSTFFGQKDQSYENLEAYNLEDSKNEEKKKA
uniref:Col_cuticle_N domain-containing protein n=1 Tax=Parastrongyloides trichosuri TaxID=131310 RepID=A0A0N4ZY57_PARTI